MTMNLWKTTESIRKGRQGRTREEVEMGWIPGRMENAIKLLCYTYRSLPQCIIRECTTPVLHIYDVRKARTALGALGDTVEGST